MFSLHALGRHTCKSLLVSRCQCLMLDICAVVCHVSAVLIVACHHALSKAADLQHTVVWYPLTSVEDWMDDFEL